MTAPVAAKDVQETIQLQKKARTLFDNREFGEAREILTPVLKKDSEAVWALNLMANIDWHEGRRDAAISLLEDSCRIKKGHAPLFALLGTFQFQQRRNKEAEAALKNALKINENYTPALRQLGDLYTRLNDVQLATQNYARAVMSLQNDREENAAAIRVKQAYARSLGGLKFQSFSPVQKSALVECLKDDRVSDRNLINVWRDFIECDPMFAALRAFSDIEETTHIGKKNESPLVSLQPLLNSDFFLSGLHRGPVADIKYEKILTKLRAQLLHDYESRNLTVCSENLDFIANLGIHCFLNDYVFTITEDEIRRVGKLESDLARATGQDHLIGAAVLACYKPLHETDNGETLERELGRQDNEHVKKLIRTHLTEPREEKLISETIPCHGSISGDVSKAVRAQYEENPYPRWRGVNAPLRKRNPTWPNQDILVAGCGTGQQPASHVATYPDSRFLCVDLSLRSLSYAKRQAEKMGLDQLSFLQGDILELDSLDRQFDIILCSGVLHHMEVPEAGLRVLKQRLKSGGFMKIALYSEYGRRAIVKARTIIAEKNLTPTPENIRHMREIIIESDDKTLSDCMQYSDFFNLSECRDMIFHVQEHRYTIPQIVDMLAEENLALVKFHSILPKFMTAFRDRHPDPDDLYDFEKWDQFEQDNPKTFLSMYKFYVCHEDDLAQMRKKLT